MTVFGNSMLVNPGNLGMRLSKAKQSGAVALWWNPLNSAAINARAAAGGLWAWRAQANATTWGAGPANYAASLISVEGNAVVLAEIGGGSVNWAAATGWSGFSVLVRCLDTGIVPVNDQSYVMFVQWSNVTANSFPGGQRDGGGREFSIRQRASIDYSNGGIVIVPGGMATGNAAIVGASGYRNGVVDGAIPAGVGLMTLSIYIGARNAGVINAPIDGEIQAVIICDDSTAFTGADITAIAASPGGSMHNL